ncbi:MAG: hypothetical protein ING21_10450 [Burkholderiales bacterium]|jgi:uncharacterized protein (DUF2345 family)|nr:hypothetical protein [Burkholderiales bacterium]MCA3162676.1 hypothetical protein [Burkholderiales bacterium]MCA3166895.1 hypothetical protein [Burkholderiales bacterium]MCA3170490.1 hypothetical protein [Burkholderiales bacterium]MCA3172804.1 hypothetical protein [Burkholderiales bacterium]
MNGANVALKTPGTVSWKAASKNAGGALSGGTSLPTLPVGGVKLEPQQKEIYNDYFIVEDTLGRPIKNTPYIFTHQTTGQTLEGRTDSAGRIPLQQDFDANDWELSFEAYKKS